MPASPHEPDFPTLAAWRLLLLGLVVVAIAGLPCGCSCKRTPREPWDAGLQISGAKQGRATDESGAAGPGATGSGSGSGSGSGNSAEPGAAGGGADGDAGSGQGEAGHEGAREGKAPGSGSDDRDDRASGEAKQAEGGGRAAATASTAASEPPGIGDASGAGGSNEPRSAAGIFPGRPAVPELGVAEAIRAATDNLTAAQLAQDRGRFVDAYDLAARAYELVQPHAAGYPECKKLAGTAMDMLRDLAKKLPKPPRPRSQTTTTFFE